MKNTMINIGTGVMLAVSYLFLLAVHLIVLVIMFGQHIIFAIIAPQKTARLYKYYRIAQDTVFKTVEDPIAKTVEKKLAEMSGGKK